MRDRFVLAVSLCVLGCSNGQSMPAPPDMATPATPMLLQACTDTVSDVYAAPTGLPAYDSSHRGDVVRCAFDTYIPASRLGGRVAAYGYLGAPLQSGASVFRVPSRPERTKRGPPTPAEATATADLLIPDRPFAADAPLVVFA